MRNNFSEGKRSMEKVNVAFIGLGCRGGGLMGTIIDFEDVNITAVCDKYEDRVEEKARFVKEKKGVLPFGTTDYKEVLARDDVDAVIIATDWELHIPIAVDAMRAGKAVALEVGGAYSIEDCFHLVKTWEDTKVPFMFLENCCYNREELLATAMVRRGMLGKIVHCHGAYAHDLRCEVTHGKENRHYRLRNYLGRNCENYPTHELGPIAKVLDINRGNRMTSLVSVASGSFGIEQYVEDNKNNINPELIGTKFAQGDIVNTIITCAGGETITLRLDTSLPRFYNREFTVHGTKGLYEQHANTVFFDGDAEKYWISADYVKENINNADKYAYLLPQAWKNITKEMLEAGHGGMDYLELRDFIDRLKNGDGMPIDVYDASSWMCISCLSEQSIREGGAPVEIPDFTNGEWKNRHSLDVYDLL